MRKQQALILLQEKTTLLQQCREQLTRVLRNENRVPELEATVAAQGTVIAQLETENQKLADKLTRARAALAN